MSDNIKDTVSVVCPTFNSANYIEKTLNCIQSQKRPPNQLVIVDDGSSDDTISIIEDYYRSFPPSFNLIVEQINHQGPGAARNKGIELSNSDWIAFLDSDDHWHAQKLERVFRAVALYRNCNFFCHDEIHVRLNGTSKVVKYSNADLTNNLTRQLYMANRFSTSAIVCRKSLLEKAGGFDITLSSAQDYELWLRMSEEISVFMIPETLGSYIARPNNITNSRFKSRLFNELYIAKRYSFQVPTIIFVIKLARILLSITKQYIRNKVERLNIGNNKREK
jgi:glycosyltransferase involved in cell wall biosynthesis